ncbi:Protein of unknown function DUF361 [Methanocaldococcus sp. FS406-22]|uniref:hypothetical protein n=1 Tax=Methanocaldococcus sp. (strain FS406-22) TaxID=644281 RepID=UPI0001BF4BCB|nr:hypothetical protein [Methanocaldococcus sp. FS406-22]ADC69645.1 Protein of unknown function DUF361 [Methanocaldococcus sp. FS406-22]
MYKDKIIKKRGQLSIDFILAVLFLMLVSVFIYYNVLTFTNNTTDALIVDRMYSIADTFENYAILSYTKNETIVLKLKPIGDLGYTIHVSDKIINVNFETFVIFAPTDNGVVISGDTVNNAPVDIGKNISITATIGKNNVTIRKELIINIT